MAVPWVRRYLEVLGVDDTALGLGSLTAIMRGQRRIVFENVTSLLRRAATPEGLVPPLDEEALLASWEHRTAGAVCYEGVTMLNRLLRGLGYDAVPVMARITFSGSHQAIVVDLNGQRLLVDSSNGAPFFEPIPLGGTVEFAHLGLRYRFRTDEESGEPVQDRWIDAEWKAFCRYDLMESTAAQREQVYQRHHLLPGESFVMNTLRLVLCTDAEVLSLLDH
jgi:arylamine N-acetyltransferase